MADSLHNVLASFRDSILQSIARLEFQMRDIAAAQRFMPTQSVYEVPATDSTIQELISRIETLEMKLAESTTKLNESVTKHGEFTNLAESVTKHGEFTNLAESVTKHDFHMKKEPTGTFDEIEEIIAIEQPTNTRNIIVLSAVSTPALAAAVAAANSVPQFITLDSASEKVSVHSGEVIEEDDTEESEESSGPELTKVIIKAVAYYMDKNNTVYQETEDGYEEVGTYNPKLDRIEVEEDVDMEEEEVEAIETEEFVYKGQTYQRDAEGNVYDDEGDVIGHWNGKKIVAVA